MTPITVNQNTSATNRNVASLLLTGSLTVEDIEAARTALTKNLGASGQIVIDCCGLHKIDEHGLKFLCAAHRHIMSRGRTVEFIGLSPELVFAAKREMKSFVPGLSCQHSMRTNCLWA